MSFDREAIEAEIESMIAADSDVFDFGFSFADTDEVAQESSLVQSTSDSMSSIERIILPLLVNMKKDPERDYILWKGHDRVSQCNLAIERLLNITRG
tara:strand:+ start:2758 stop:3048 length:291 start_codon:yes stop_codon:yes gene_type:complete